MSDHTAPERGGDQEGPEQVMLRALAASVERRATHVPALVPWKNEE